MARFQRTTKKLAQRIDLQYFTRPHPLRRWRFLLSVACVALAVVWIGWYGARRSDKVYSSGRMAAAHAVLTANCAACHVSRTGVFREHTTDQACLACHDGPIHHANQLFTPACASCHVEHQGPVRLAATPDAMCTQCHANLQAKGTAPPFERSIENFNTRHPEFGALRLGHRDPSTIKLNHAVHMKPIRVRPGGPLVELDCSDCHRAPTDTGPWLYGDAQYKMAAVQLPDPLAPKPTRALMAPTQFAKYCAACHQLTFDKRFAEGVPHGKQPNEIHDFLAKQFEAYIGGHPAELRVVREPDRNLAEKPMVPSVRVLTPPQWVAERASEAEQLLWRKTCKQCHTLTFEGGTPLPQIAKANITVRWMPHARFDHYAHRMMNCTSCHTAALTSEQTADLLLPGIATCQACHRPAVDAAESRCFECHTYHDWKREKPVKGVRVHITTQGALELTAEPGRTNSPAPIPR